MTSRVLMQEAQTRFGPVFLAATDAGLCRITTPGQSKGELLAWLERRIPDADVTPADGALAAPAAALAAFLEDGTPIPPLPVQLIGTPFQRAVWSAVLEIPYGETRSYVEIGRTIGYPQAPRAVGAANARCPLPFVVPCHRVIGADGSIKGYPGGIITRGMLLELEGWTAPGAAEPTARYTEGNNPARSGRGRRRWSEKADDHTAVPASRGRLGGRRPDLPQL